MENNVSWVPDVRNARWAPAPTETEYEGEKAILKGGAVEVPCSICSGNAAAGPIGGLGNGSVEFHGVQSLQDTRSTVRIVYTNDDTRERYARVIVNNVSQAISFLPTGTVGGLNSASLHVDLAAWSSNPISIEGLTLSRAQVLIEYSYRTASTYEIAPQE